jgi:WD40 repeat protein
MTFSPDGKTLVSAVYGGAITLWNPNDGTKQFTLSMKGAQVFALNPDGQTLAIGSEDKTIKLLSLKYEPKLAQSLKVKLKQGRFVGFSPDQQSLILAGGPEIKQLRLKDHRALTAPKTQPDQFFASFALSPNAQMLAGGGWNQPIHLWNLKDGTLLRTLPKDGLPKDDQSYVASIAFSPDGQRLATAKLFTRKIQLWNLDNGNLLHTLDVNAVWVVFSPDGQLLVSGGGDGAIHLWNPQTGQKLGTLKGHGSGISALAFSPDGETLASGSSDQTIKLWRVKRKD